jgi:hypothetical protein
MLLFFKHRFAQYLDTLCNDLGVPAIRWGFPASAFTRMFGNDYTNIVQEYKTFKQQDGISSDNPRIGQNIMM